MWERETVLDGVSIGHAHLSDGWVRGSIWEVVGCIGVWGFALLRSVVKRGLG